MPEHWTCRLLVVGPVKQVKAFADGNWDRRLGAKHCEILERSPGRHCWQFELQRLPLNEFGRLSSRFPDLVLFLEYEAEKARLKEWPEHGKGGWISASSAIETTTVAGRMGRFVRPYSLRRFRKSLVEAAHPDNNPRQE